jgi:hypothetical protein
VLAFTPGLSSPSISTPSQPVPGPLKLWGCHAHGYSPSSPKPAPRSKGCTRSRRSATWPSPPEKRKPSRRESRELEAVSVILVSPESPQLSRVSAETPSAPATVDVGLPTPPGCLPGWPPSEKDRVRRPENRCRNDEEMTLVLPALVEG